MSTRLRSSPAALASCAAQIASCSSKSSADRPSGPAQRIRTPCTSSGRRSPTAAAASSIFQRYNAKTTTLFDVTFDEGRAPEETFLDLSEEEA
jgi:hypothetical protein